MSRLFIAVELGEELGRVLLGTLHKGQLSLSEVHRFHNVPIREKKEVFWDAAQMYQDTLSGLLTVGLYDEPVDGISCTSWDADFLLFHADASFIPPTRHHADPRTAEGRKEVLTKMREEYLYEETGRPDSPRSTLYQVAGEKPRHLKRADHLMPIADGFNFLLSGAPCVEASAASATRLFNPRSRYWSETLRSTLDLPATLLPTVIPAGTKLKPLRPELALATRLEGAQIVASCSNELAAMLAGLPVQEDERWGFVHLGQSSLIGASFSEPVINPDSCKAGLHHTLGHHNAIFGHLASHGLQLLEACRAGWDGTDYAMDDAALAHLAATAAPLESIVNLDDPRFATADDLVPKVQAFCRETSQTVPRKPGPIYRCLMESLAFLYRHKLDEITRLTGREFTHLHLVGETHHSMLNHFIANATQLPVLVAPADQTALGNILVQAMALGAIKDLDQARAINQQSIKRPTILPNPAATWTPVYHRFREFANASAQPVPA